VDGYLTLKRACRLFPGRDGDSISLPTLYRWAEFGVRGVKLRTVRSGGLRVTTPAWCADFVREVTAATDGKPAAGAVTAPPDPDRQQHVAAQLDKLGL
jgi:hypothetical protein